MHADNRDVILKVQTFSKYRDFMLKKTETLRLNADVMLKMQKPGRLHLHKVSAF